MSGGEQAKNTLYENGIGWALLLLVLGILGWMFWSYYDAETRSLIRWIRYSEMWVLSWFISDDYTVFFNGEEANWHQGFENTPKWSAEALRYEHLAYFNALAMQPLKIVFVIIMALAAVWSIFKGPHTHCRSTLDLEGLIKRQAVNFPVIAPFVSFNPSTQPPRAPGSPVPADLPLFAEALGPEEWLAYNNIPVPDGQIHEASARKAFQKQLGGRWKGPKGLEPYRQILLAAFCLKAARKRGDSDDMLSRLSLCWSFKNGLKLNRDRKLIKDAHKILRNKEIAGKTLSQVNRHAFTTTAMLRALSVAREEGGVLAPAQFAWLRGHDRTLWYALNNLGRQSFHMEALGSMSHFRAERMTQRPIPVPKLEDAVETIVDYMGSNRARPIPQLDYSQSKKRGVKKAR